MKKGTSINISQQTSGGPSPYPCLDKFVLTCLATRGGVSGSIRAWAISPGRNNDNSTGIITYHMKDNRWCEYIGRAHKGNNIMWNISLKDMIYYQLCHDPDCRRAGFRGQVKLLPDEVQEELKDSLLSKALEVDSEFEKALMALSISHDSVERSEGTDNKANIQESNIVATPTEPRSDSTADASVWCEEANPSTSDFQRTYSVDSSFEVALIDFINSNPDLCP